MPHDKNGSPLAVGDAVILTGKVKAITSEHPEYCNITFGCDIGMTADHPDYSIALSARMVEKVGQAPAAPLSANDITADKELRVALDIQLQRLKGLPASRERSLTITKLQEAIMWLGMDLKRLAAPNPYPNSYDPTNAIVDPTADSLKL